MDDIFKKYKAVIGLEVHAQLLTMSKAFSGDHYEYGGKPNTQVSPVTLGHPGTLPKPNTGALRYAIKMGLATHSQIHHQTYFNRKNYFYPDLPKGYQITQYTTPLCTEGYLVIESKNGEEKKVGIEKIILEEDSGKSIHDLDPFSTLIDLNRAGVPLIEIVSHPHMESPEEAYNYLTGVRKLVRYLDICDGNMEEGSLRCDVNVSVMLKEDEKYGTKVEIKNLNSIRNVQRAIDYEIQRQVKRIEKGEKITHETRGFNPPEGKTFEMRTKEMAEDYRFFPEPDIPPLVINEDFIEQVKTLMPELPYDRERKYVEEYGLKQSDARLLASERDFGDYFEKVISRKSNYKAATNWMIGPVRSWLNDQAITIKEFPLKPDDIAALIGLIDSGKVSFSIASQELFPELIKAPGKDPKTLAKEKNLIQVGDDSFLLDLINDALGRYPEKVQEYKDGKKGLLGLFMGEVMKMSKGKADPKKANQLLRKELEKV